MRMLITNARMSVRAGSELATLELADAYRRRGDEVAIFTLVPGDVGASYAQRSGVRVLGIADDEALRNFAPDFIHVHHWPTALTLEWLGVQAPWVIGFLGSLPPLENPPPLYPGKQVPWWTLNAVAEERFSQIPGWADSPHEIVGNWFDDHGMTKSPVAPKKRIRSMIVVSNHFPESVMADLNTVCKALDIEITHVGLPENSVVVNGELLRQFDCVITIGRTVPLALASGIPALVLDHFGADGWVTPENVAAIANHNFSGKWTQTEVTPEKLLGWLTDAPSTVDREELQTWAFENASLTHAMTRMEVLHSQPCTGAPSQVFGLGSLAVGEMLNEFDALRRGGVDAVSRKFEALLDEAKAENMQAIAQRDEAIALREAIETSRVWRYTHPYRRLKSRATKLRVAK